MTATFRSIVFPSRGLVEVRELPESAVPDPGPHEVRCRARTSLISTGTETFCLEGTFDDGTFWQEWVQYPFLPGYSMTAQVEAVGDAVTGVAVGDRVATSTPHEEVFLAAAADAVAVPADVSDDQACWASLACTTQLGVRRAQVELGETAVIVGLGVLGQLVVQYLRLSGARTIVAVDPVPARLDLARAGGATHTLALDAAAAVEAVRELTAVTWPTSRSTSPATPRCSRPRPAGDAPGPGGAARRQPDPSRQRLARASSRTRCR